MTNEWDVIVVGGGLAGLTAAATAKQSGAKVLVVEAHQPGGRARTVERDGFIFNMGGHALYRGGPGWKVLHTLGITPDGQAPPMDRYRALVDGHQHRLPTGPGSLLRTGALGMRSRAQLAALLARLPRMNPANLSTTPVVDWLGSFRLRPDADALVRALIRLSTYTAAVDEFSADAAVSQLQAASTAGVLYLHGGWSQLVDALSRKLEVRSGVDVTGVEPTRGRVEVHTREGDLTASRVILATGAPPAVQRLLPADPGWGDLGAPLTAACLDLGVSHPPEPGYVLSLDDPLYATTQSPPARQAPEGQAVVAAIRYGARSAEADRAQLDGMVAEAGIRPGDVVNSRFLAHMTVAGTIPRARNGGVSGRPGVEDTGVPGVTMAGDWVGHAGLLADAALASGHAAGLLSGRNGAGSATMVA
jgi:phytoene dehydrogenase-like protein